MAHLRSHVSPARFYLANPAHSAHLTHDVSQALHLALAHQQVQLGRGCLVVCLRHFALLVLIFQVISIIVRDWIASSLLLHQLIIFLQLIGKIASVINLVWPLFLALVQHLQGVRHPSAKDWSRKGDLRGSSSPVKRCPKDLEKIC